MTNVKKNDIPKIVLAEDERLLLATMSIGLEEAGFKVIKAEDGEEALNLCLQHKPNLAILDINMPKMSGLKVAECLLTQSNTPFMFMTAYADEEFIQNANNMGALGFLVKPMLVEQVIPEVRMALTRIDDFNQARDNEKKLKRALDTTQNINLAVGIIMGNYHLNVSEAFSRVRSQARSERRKLVDVANDITQAAEVLYQFNIKK